MPIRRIFVSTQLSYWCYTVLKLLYQPLHVLDIAEVQNTEVILAKKSQLKAIYATEYLFAISEVCLVIGFFSHYLSEKLAVSRVWKYLNTSFNTQMFI